MPGGRPPKTHIDEFYDDIVELRLQRLPLPRIYQFLADHNVDISLETLKRRIRIWDLPLPTDSIWDHWDLACLMYTLFYIYGMDDTQMLHILEFRHGYPLTRGRMVRYRFEMGMRRRSHDAEAADNEARAMIQRDYPSGQIRGYGKDLLYAHFRSGGCLIARNRLQRIMKELHPEDVARRLYVYSSSAVQLILWGH
jgi:hypothetical protein